MLVVDTSSMTRAARMHGESRVCATAFSLTNLGRRPHGRDELEGQQVGVVQVQQALPAPAQVVQDAREQRAQGSLRGKAAIGHVST
jgi:hypothetical protein